MRTAVTIALALLLASEASAQDTHWVGTWAAASAWRAAMTQATAAAPATPPTTPPATASTASPPLWSQRQTLRQIIHTTIAGSRVRVVLTNVYGTQPLPIEGASVALRERESAIQPASARPLTFAGQRTVTIPPNAVMVSDPVDLRVAADADLAIDLFSPVDTATWPSPVTFHNGAVQTSYLSQAGNFVGQTSFPVSTTTSSWFFLSRVEVEAPRSNVAIIAIGDSITDGSASTRDANHRYPDHVARRLREHSIQLAVLNAGIGGNRLLSELDSTRGINLLARWERDVLAVPGARYVIVLEGINDIGGRGMQTKPSAEELIAAHRQVIDRAHADGLLIYGATLTPFEGADYYTPDGEAKRQALNTWIRTSKAYDAVIDFDAATRDPGHPTRFLPPYDSGDHLHPNDAGYKAIADSIDLNLFRR